MQEAKNLDDNHCSYKKKDNSSINLIEILRSRKSFITSANYNIQSLEDLESEFNMIRTNCLNFLNYDIIDIIHINKLISNFDKLMKEINAIKNSTSLTTSMFIINILILIKNLFASFDMLIDVSDQLYSLINDLY